MADVKSKVFDEYIFDCNHNKKIKHEMGFVCKECGLVLPRISYNYYMIRKFDKHRNMSSKFHRHVVLTPYNLHIHRLDKKIKLNGENERNYVERHVRLLISHFNLTISWEEATIMTRIIRQYRVWHKQKLPRIDTTNFIEHVIPACFLVMVRQKGILIQREELVAFCNINLQIFNKTFILACEFLGFRNSYETNFKNFVLYIIHSLNLPFWVFNDSFYLFKKFNRFFTSKPKNCAVLCVILSYYSKAKITDFHDNVRLFPITSRYKYQNLFPNRGECKRLLAYLKIPIKCTKDVYGLWKYRKRLFS